MSGVQGQFKGRVYGPILLDVSVPEPQHAKYLEMHFASAFFSCPNTSFRSILLSCRPALDCCRRLTRLGWWCEGRHIASPLFWAALGVCVHSGVASKWDKVRFWPLGIRAFQGSPKDDQRHGSITTSTCGARQRCRGRLLAEHASGTPVLRGAAGNFWTRFVTEYAEDQDTLRNAARQFRFSPIITNFTASANAPLARPDGDAARYAKYNL